MRTLRAGLVLFALALLAVPALAHVPSFPEDNTTPERAVAVPDATKSWSFYDRLGDGEVRYYRASLAADQRLRVSTFTPVRGAFAPSFVVMSPSLSGHDSVPAGVTVPGGMGAVVVPGSRPAEAAYEPFTPSATYRTASIDRPVEAETTYLVAIYEPSNRTGPVGVTVGYRESFSAVEYVTVPFDLVRTHRWAGQHPLVVFGPFVAAVLFGLGAVRARRSRPEMESPVRPAVRFAGLLILASGVQTAVQMGLALSQTGLTPAAFVTGAFVVLPVVCGGWAVWLTLRREFAFTAGTRVALGVTGVVALMTWAGFVAGPAILLAVAVAPKRFLAGTTTERSSRTD